MKIMKIFYIQYTNPGAYPPLEHSSELLAKTHWQVLFWGIHCFGTNDSVCFADTQSRRVHLLPYCPKGWVQKLHYLVYTFIAVVIVAIWRPDWIYASDHFSCLPALMIKKLFRTSVLYHEHDSPDPSEIHSVFLKCIHKMRIKLAQIADICILPNDKRLGLFLTPTGRKLLTFCVWNCPQKSDMLPVSVKTYPDIRFYFHGTITPRNFPLVFLKGFANVASKGVFLTIVGSETVDSHGYINLLHDEACRLKVCHALTILPAMGRNELYVKCSEHDVGLVACGSRLDTDLNWQNMLGASNKVFDYMACGLALLVPESQDWHKMIVAPGYGMSFCPESQESLENVLTWFLSHPNETRKMGERGRNKIFTDWNYESQFAPVFDLLVGKPS